MSTHSLKMVFTILATSLLIALLTGCAKEDDTNPKVSEEETGIPTINKIRARFMNINIATFHTFELTSFVGVDDSDEKSHFNTKDGGVYSEDEVNQNLSLSEDIAISFHALSTTGTLYCSASPMTQAYYDNKGWDISETKYQDASISVAQFNALTQSDISTIEGAFNDVGGSSTQISIYENNSPLIGKVIAFKTDDGRRGLIKVNNITGDVLNDLTGNLKAELSVWIAP